VDREPLFPTRPPRRLRWEHILTAILGVVVLVNSLISPEFLNLENLLSITQVFIEKGVLGLALLLLIVSGNIDLSCASILALSASVFGIAFQAHIPIWICMVLALCIGTAGGFFNGFVVSRTGIPSIIVTLVSLSLFRGLAFGLMKDYGVYGFPESFLSIGNGKVPGTFLPYSLLFFVALSIPFAITLSRSRAGKKIYMVGSNARASFVAGISVKATTLTLFTLAGFFYAVAAILLVSRIGSVRPNIATGFELDTIATIVFGGVAIYGGKGTFAGFILSLFTLGYVRFGLGLKNVPGQLMVIITGIILICSILASNALQRLAERRNAGLVQSSSEKASPSGGAASSK
jgi:rhamnose transport system permease protein